MFLYPLYCICRSRARLLFSSYLGSIFPLPINVFAMYSTVAWTVCTSGVLKVWLENQASFPNLENAPKILIHWKGKKPPRRGTVIFLLFCGIPPSISKHYFYHLLCFSALSLHGQTRQWYINKLEYLWRQRIFVYFFWQLLRDSGKDQSDEFLGE